jgi:hypothetical protein
MINRESSFCNEIKNNPKLRISCASFTKIIDPLGRFAVMKNIKNAEPVFTPIGGGVEVTSMGKIELYSLLTNINFQEGKDMRFTMDGKGVDILRQWFLQRNSANRELYPTRELIKELTKEYRILLPTDFRMIMYGVPGYYEEIGKSYRPGHEDELTFRIIEVFPTQLTKEAQLKLILFANIKDSPLRFVTREEIMQLRTKNGLEIGSVTKSLIQSKTIMK